MFGGGAKPIGGGALAPPGPYGSYGPVNDFYTLFIIVFNYGKIWSIIIACN